MTVLLMMALSALVLSGCTFRPSTLKPALLEEEGEVYVYLQPFSRDAERLTFAIDRLALVASDGREFPLSLAMTDFRPNELKRQRFLAVGRVQQGKYAGLSYKVTRARLAGEEGEADLLVPEEPVQVPLSFEVGRRKAVLLTLEFRAADSVQGGFRFTPRFSLTIPPLPAVGLMGYTVNRDDNTVSIFDKKSGQVASVIATGRVPESAVFDKKAFRSYISLAGEDAVEVIDVSEGTSVDQIVLNIGDGPRELALTPDGTVLLAVNAAASTLSFLDPVLLTELSRVPLGEGPRSLLIDRKGVRCYVFNRLSNTISVIDIANRAVVTTLSVDAGPLMGQFDRRGTRLYVIHDGSPYISVIDPLTLTLVRRAHVGMGLVFIKLDVATDLLYAARRGESRIEVYDLVSLVPRDYIAAQSGVAHMTIDGESNTLLVVSEETNRLLSISLVSKKTASETDTGRGPSWVAVIGER